MSISNITRTREAYQSVRFQNTYPHKRGLNRILADQESDTVFLIQFLAQQNQGPVLKELHDFYESRSNDFFLKTIFQIYTDRGIKNIMYPSLLGTAGLGVKYLYLFTLPRDSVDTVGSLWLDFQKLSESFFVKDGIHQYQQYKNRVLKECLNMGITQHHVFIRYILTHSTDHFTDQECIDVEKYIKKLLCYMVRSKQKLIKNNHYFKGSVYKKALNTLFDQNQDLKQRVEGTKAWNNYKEAYLHY